MQNQELTMKYLRLRAVEECKNQLGRMMYYTSTFENNETDALWSKRADCCLTTPWGVYEGRQSVRRFYLHDCGERSQPGFLEKLKGALFVHSIDTAVITVDEDASHARGVWTMEGVDTWLEDAKPSGHWSRGKFEVEFLCEDGSWKIWKLTFHPLYLTKYDTGWTQELGWKNLPFDLTPDRPQTNPMWAYSPEAVYPAAQPDSSLHFSDQSAI